MTATEHQAILTISLLAAFADGQKHARERDAIQRIADGLGQAEGVHMPTLYQDVLLKRVTLDTAVPQLAGADARLLAYEMAVCVCDADGAQSTAEQAFLADLGRRLGVDAPAASSFAQQAEALAQAPIPASVPAPAAPVASAPAAPAATAAVTSVDQAALDKTILNAAILNGALELLPQSVASLAIIPLQMRLVYRIGQAHGYELDRGHVKDLLAAMGVGLTGQYLEGIGRKLVGGLLGRAAGGLAKSVGRTATSAAFSFATTWALGQVAKRYYAGGRVMSTAMLQQAFTELAGEGRSLQQQYLPRIQEQARTLDPGKVLAMVTGGGRAPQP